VRAAFTERMPRGSRLDVRKEANNAARKVVRLWSAAEEAEFRSSSQLPGWAMTYSSAGTSTASSSAAPPPSAAASAAPPPPVAASAATPAAASGSTTPAASAVAEVTPTKRPRCETSIAFDMYFETVWRGFLHAGEEGLARLVARSIVKPRAWESWQSLGDATRAGFVLQVRQSLAASSDEQQGRDDDGRFVKKVALDFDTLPLTALVTPTKKPAPSVSVRMQRDLGKALLAVAEECKVTGAYGAKNFLNDIYSKVSASRMAKRKLPMHTRATKFNRRKFVRHQGGRRKGWTKVPRTQLLETLASHTTETCRFKANGDPLLALQGTVRQVHKADPSIAGLYSRRHLSRLLARARLGISRRARRTDQCEVCMQYDSHSVPRLKVFLRLINDSISEYLPAYWSIDYDLEKLVLPSGLNMLAKHMKLHRVGHATERAELLDASLEKLQEPLDFGASFRMCRSGSFPFV
jgi:hypothetical protein